MELALNSEKVAVTLLLNPSDVQDVLAVIRALRFPIQIALPKKTEKAKQNGTTNGQSSKTDYLTDPEWLERQARGKALMLEMIKIDSDDVPELPEDEMMELINSEIKAYHAEQIALEKAQLQTNH
jgi:hypothetical protein